MIHLLLTCWFSVAEAQSPSNDPVEMSDTVSGKGVKSLQLEDRTDAEVVYEDEMIGKYPKRIHDGARWLNMSEEFVWYCWLVMKGLYDRDYKSLQKVLTEVLQKYPGSGVAPVGRALMWQVLMLENFDFKFEKQYKVSFDIARQELEQAMLVPGNDSWETFLMGAILGVDAIHELRKEDFLAAINQGYEAVKFIESAKKKAPNFVDSQLGDGLWLYWRSLIASNVPGIPTFSDERAAGIEMMQRAERESVFLRPAASHALTYTWIEERKMKMALQKARMLRKAYPNNVINLQVLGRVEMYNKKYADSERTFRNVLKISPKNQRAHFYLARLYLRMKRYQDAEKEIDIYLKFDTNDYQKGYAYYYKGHIMMRQKRYKEAARAYDKAWQVDKVKGAKERAEKARTKAKEAKN